MSCIREALRNEASSITGIISYGSREGQVIPRTCSDISQNIDTFLVALQYRGVVGCVALDRYYRENGQPSKLAEIRSLVVVPEFRHKGLGRELVQRCIEKAHDMGVDEILAISDKIDFFAKFGLKQTLNGQEALILKL